MHITSCLKRKLGKNEVEWTGKVELLAADEARRALFWPTHQAWALSPLIALGCQQRGPSFLLSVWPHRLGMGLEGRWSGGEEDKNWKRKTERRKFWEERFVSGQRRRWWRILLAEEQMGNLNPRVKLQLFCGWHTQVGWLFYSRSDSLFYTCELVVFVRCTNKSYISWATLLYVSVRVSAVRSQSPPQWPGEQTSTF